MKKIVVLPGGYHPYHAGHYSLYKAAEEKFPDADVYLAATNDTKSRPFPFEIKKKLAQLAGVNPNQFVQVKSPFKVEEITQKYDPEQDVLIFVRSEKDRNEQPKPGGTKKDGSPSYFQSYDPDNLESFNKHAYIDYLPTIEFGPGIKSASEIRNAWPNLNNKQKLAMVMSLYPKTQQNKKLADVAVKMLDAGIIGDQVNEEDVEETFNKPYKAKWVKGEFGDYDALVKLPDGTNLSIMFNNEGDDTWQIEFYRANTQEITGEGDAQRIFATVLDAIQKFIKKQKPRRVIFSASKDVELEQNAESRSKLYDRLVARYASAWGYDEHKEDHGDKVTYELTRLEKQGVEEATLINDPEQGHLIQPDGGMGTWDEQSLLSNLTRKFSSMVEMIKEKRYSNLYHSLYEAGVVENMLKALVEYENFKTKQGNRPIAKNRSIDISQVTESTDYISEK
jgi:hypothetical protein